MSAGNFLDTDDEKKNYTIVPSLRKNVEYLSLIFLSDKIN